MMALILAFLALFRRLKSHFDNPEFRALGLLTILVLLLGTIFFNRVEGFSLVDAFYFSVVTLATVGYGDFVPKTPVEKLFTVLYIFLGVGILTAFISIISGRRKIK